VPDEFLTVAEIAELLKLNGQTIRNWIDRGELPAVRVGSRRVRVRRSDLDAFLEASSTSRTDAGSRESVPLFPEPVAFAGLRESALCPNLPRGPAHPHGLPSGMVRARGRDARSA
jgi:excisionase family DNA binding protein